MAGLAQLTVKMKIPDYRFCCLILAVAIVASWCSAGKAFAQSGSPTTSVAVAPLTHEESMVVGKVALADPRTRAIVGAGPARVITADVEPDKAEAEAYLAGTASSPPTRRVSVVLFNTQTNRAARALVSPQQNLVLAVQPIEVSDVPFVRDDVDEALELAKRDPAVRRVVGDTLDRFKVLDSGSNVTVPFAAQALPLRSTNPHDQCTVHRCLDLIFRTEHGYLPVRAHVDLTKRSVTVEGRGSH